MVEKKKPRGGEDGQICLGSRTFDSLLNRIIHPYKERGRLVFASSLVEAGGSNFTR